MAVNEVVVNGVTELSLANDTVSETSLLEGETAHAANGEAIVGKAKYINPNLLINSNLSINQKGQAEYTEGGYIVDGWRISSGTIYNTESKTMSAKSSDGLEYYIEQVVENAVDLCGKEITLSAEVLSTGTCVVGIYASNGIEYTIAASDVIVEGIASCTMKVPEDATLLFARVLGLGNYETTIKNVKLELGTVATLFVPPNPAVELMKCQRYLTSLMQSSVYRAVAIGTDYIDFSIPTPTTMRPISGMSIINPENFVVRSINPTADQTGFSFSVVTYGANQLRLRALKTAHGLTDATLAVKSSSTVFLSAEL